MLAALVAIAAAVGIIVLKNGDDNEPSSARPSPAAPPSIPPAIKDEVDAFVGKWSVTATIVDTTGTVTNADGDILDIGDSIFPAPQTWTVKLTTCDAETCQASLATPDGNYKIEYLGSVWGGGGDMKVACNDGKEQTSFSVMTAAHQDDGSYTGRRDMTINCSPFGYYDSEITMLKIG